MAWQMAHAARVCRIILRRCGRDEVRSREGEIANVACFEGGHPCGRKLLRLADAALALTEDLTESDTVVFLLSGGAARARKTAASAPRCGTSPNQLLAAGAGIVGSLTIRKRLSAVKRQTLPWHCAPAQVTLRCRAGRYSGRPARAIASGPAISRRLQANASSMFTERQPAPVRIGPTSNWRPPGNSKYQRRST